MKPSISFIFDCNSICSDVFVDKVLYENLQYVVYQNARAAIRITFYKHIPNRVHSSTTFDYRCLFHPSPSPATSLAHLPNIPLGLALIFKHPKFTPRSLARPELPPPPPPQPSQPSQYHVSFHPQPQASYPPPLYQIPIPYLRLEMLCYAALRDSQLSRQIWQY